MKLLLELNDKNIGLIESESFSLKYNLRKAARAVVYNEKGEIALLYVSKHNCHKLPGGGLEEGEDIETALKREVLEETGCQINILGEIGMTIEYRNQLNLLQISFCYIAESFGEIIPPNYDEGELADGFQPIWVSIDKAISLVENDQPNYYKGKFMQKRDITIIKEALRIKNNSPLERGWGV